MLDYIHCGIGIEARVAVCQEDLQPLIDLGFPRFCGQLLKGTSKNPVMCSNQPTTRVDSIVFSTY